MRATKFALIFVVFVDLLGQGLIFPIIDTLLMGRESAFLPAGTSPAARQFDYGLVIGIFFLSWFLGAAYIARLSDVIGRRNGILICLIGALAGYVLTIVALAVGSLWLLIMGRAISGFTAGSQPIAQAAMADLSSDDADRTRNLGLVVAGISLGLVGGPVIGGLLSDRALLGDLASLSLPFYAAGALVVVAMLLVVAVVRDTRRSAEPRRMEPLEMFLLLWRVGQRPVVLRISLVYFCFMYAANTFYVFMDAFLTARFDAGTLLTSAAMMLFGASLALGSSVLVPRLEGRVARRRVIVGVLVVFAVTATLYVLAPGPLVAFVPVLLFGTAFSIGYPILLAVFSASVPADEQGWVMGVSTALFTLGAGITAFVGGWLASLALWLPFGMCVSMSLLALGLLAILWRSPELRRIVDA